MDVTVLQHILINANLCSIMITPEPGLGIHHVESSSNCSPSSSLNCSLSSASAYSRGYTSTDTEAGYTSGGPRYSFEELVKKKQKEYKGYKSAELCSCKLLHLL